MRVRPLPKPADVDRLDRAAAQHPDDKRRARPGARYGAATTAGASGRAASSSTSRSAFRPAFATRAATATGRSRWIARSRKMTNRRMPSPRNAPARVMPTFGTLVRLDVPQQRVRERERADQDREHGLERPVAVEDPHVARGERARRHLHDQHADGDDEADEAHARRHDRGEHRLGRRGRVLPARADVDDRADVRRHETEASSRARRRPAGPPTGSPAGSGGAGTRRSRSTRSRAHAELSATLHFDRSLARHRDPRALLAGVIRSVEHPRPLQMVESRRSSRSI